MVGISTVRLLAKGDRVWLSGGYDMEPKWLTGADGYRATVIDYLPGQNKKDALLVELDSDLKFEEFQGKYLVLELRYVGDLWFDRGTVHLELLSETPEKKKWQEREQGKWIESHANYRKIGKLEQWLGQKV